MNGSVIHLGQLHVFFSKNLYLQIFLQYWLFNQSQNLFKTCHFLRLLWNCD